MKYINPNLTLPEILNVVSRMEGTIDEKAKMLANWQRKDVHWFVDFMYNGDTDREGIVLPEYKASNKPVGTNFMTINSALPKINAAIQHKTNKTVFDRNMKVVLESISSDEAQLLVKLFSGQKVEGISKAVFRRAFPTYFRTTED
jgi:hypothetical protein